MNKLKDSKGFTLTELLVATIIMLLVSLGLATGVALSNRQYINSIRQSEAQELYSTLSSVISNELRYTTKVYIDSSVSASTDGAKINGFYSKTYSPSSSNSKPYILIIDENGNETTDFGQLAIGQASNYNRVLNSAVYSKNLGVKVKIYYDEYNNLFNVDLEVGVINGDTIISNRWFSVRALNEISTENS